MYLNNLDVYFDLDMKMILPHIELSKDHLDLVHI